MSKLTVTKAQVVSSVSKFVADRAKSTLSFVAMVLNLAIAMRKELYLNEDGNPIGLAKVVSDKVPDGIEGASVSTVQRYVKGALKFVESAHAFTRDELTKDVSPRAYHLCRPLVDGEEGDKVLTRKQILGHLRDRTIQSETIQVALGRKVATKPSADSGSGNSAKPVMPIVQLANAVSAHRSESEKGDLADQDAIVTNIVQLFQMLDDAKQHTLARKLATSVGFGKAFETPKASAKSTPRKSTRKGRKTA